MEQEKRYRYPGINFFTKADEDIFCGRADDAQKLFNRCYGNFRRQLFGEMINTGTDIGKGDALQFIFQGQLQAVGIGICQQLFFVAFSIVPYGAYGMDNKTCWQSPGRGDDGFPRFTPALPVAYLNAFFQYGWPARPVYGAVYAATAQQ